MNLTGKSADYFAWIRVQRLNRLRRIQRNLIRVRRFFV
jgi:hypothetical protein